MFSAPTHEIQSIAILGGGTAGWMTAAALAQLLPKSHYSVTLIESDAIGTVGVGEATLPHLRFFNQRLGIDEVDFIKATKATFKLGIEFSNWGRKDDAYIHPFGDYGIPINGVGFHHYAYDIVGQPSPNKLDAYSLPIEMCKAGVFEFPNPDGQSLNSTFSYAYHIDAGRYANFLRNFAEQRDVKRIEGKAIDVIARTSDGAIDSLIMESGLRVEADFFVDCSGFRGQLIEKTLKAGYEDWSQWLPCNRAVAIPCEHKDKPKPYTKAMARDAGWQWQIPLQHRMGNGYVYCDSYLAPEQALDTLLQHLPGDSMAEPNHLRFLTGKRKSYWSHNCVAIGLSSGFLEPLESTSIYLIQAAIMKLIELVPQRQNSASKAREYNRYFDNEMERIRDFLILHYHATERDDTPFWQYCKNMSVPDSLAEKMAVYRASGYIEDYQHGLFLVPSWLAVYNGQRVYPRSGDPRRNQSQLHEVERFMRQMQHEIQNSVQQMTQHDVVVKKLCENTYSGNGPNRPAEFSLYGGR